MDLLLTDQERDRFASWLEREAETAKGIIGQLEKIYPSSHPMIAIEKKNAVAALIIARKLRNTHSETIG